MISQALYARIPQICHNFTVQWMCGLYMKSIYSVATTDGQSDGQNLPKVHNYSGVQFTDLIVMSTVLHSSASNSKLYCILIVCALYISIYLLHCNNGEQVPTLTWGTS